MAPQNSNNWRRLAEQASIEMDPEKLMSLVNELNRVLEQNQQTSRPEELKSALSRSVVLLQNRHAE
jgi:hypothetical protein